VTATIARQTGDLRADEAREIAVEAHVYLFSLVNMDLARRQMTGTGSPRAPQGRRGHRD
jgi:hypothetical protein